MARLVGHPKLGKRHISVIDKAAQTYRLHQVDTSQIIYGEPVRLPNEKVLELTEGMRF